MIETPIKNFNNKLNGFTLIELIVCVAIFAILLAGVVGCFAVVTSAVKAARLQTQISSLATNDMEIVRNMPYSQVGTMEGNPHGPLPDLSDPISENIAGSKYQIFYKVAYIHDPSDPSATGTPSYKQVEMNVLNTANNQLSYFVTTVVPQGLIADPNTGALQITVINSVGQPLPGMNVEIRYPTTSPYTYDLFDTTNNSGVVTEIGLPAGVNAYRIIASYPGYSTAQTYPITSQNPNPNHPDATVANGKVTQLTLSIDVLSNLTIDTLNQTCQPISGVNLNVSGSNLIGNTPNVLAFNNNYSSVAGAVALTGIPTDTYTPTLLTGQSNIIYGTSPIQKIDVLPGTSQTFSMILGGNSTPNSLLVIVKDATSGTALEGATVQLQENGSSQISSGITGGSVWLQNDWSGGSGQANWSTTTTSQYYQDNGEVNASNANLLQLAKIGGNYVTATATLISSTFDTGTGATNYTILSWKPTSQSPSTTLEFQIAANNDDATWNFVGPDGTPNTYFTTSGNDIGASLSNNRYVRYKVYMSTTNPAISPALTSVFVNFVTGCYTPGQTIFTGLNNDTYSVTVSIPNYQTQTITPVNVNGNQSLQVLMSP
jgi:prepilin-type N-terminal cleavage/methylation domain-containing protein